MSKKNIVLHWLHSEITEKILSSSAPILIAFSGGKDSVAMVLYLLNLGVDKSRIELHHHDVDGNGKHLFDWPCTRSYCKKFAEALGLKIFFSYREGGIYRAMYRKDEAKQDVLYQRIPDGMFYRVSSNKNAINTRMKFPAVAKSLMTRWCSAEVKIDVLRTVIARNPAYQRDLFVLTGERRQEGGIDKDGKPTGRAAYHEVELDCHYNTQKRYVISWRPVIDFSEQHVWDLFRLASIQPHPAYMLGWSRCSCQICIFNHPDIWQKIYQISPEKVDTISQSEKDFGFTLYNKNTIYDYVRKGKIPEQMSDYWIDQALAEDFTAPIIINDWHIPAGAFKTEAAGAI